VKVLKKLVGAMLVSGLLLGSSAASAAHPYPAERQFGGPGIGVQESTDDSPFPDQSKSNDYGVRGIA
jgi:hypothetical protein